MTEAADFDVAIVGGGFAGLTTGMRVAEAGLTVAVFERLGPGGELLSIASVDGVDEPTTGTDLATRLLEDAMAVGVEIQFGEVTAIETGTPLVVDGDLGRMTARAIVLATGVELRRLGVPGEAELAGRGVSYCVGCDRELFRGAPVVLVADGRYIAKEARDLAEAASAVTVLCTNADAAQAVARELDELPGTRVIGGAEVVRIDGADAVSKVAYTVGRESAEIATRAVFVCVGTEPRDEISLPGVEREADGRIRVDEHLESTVPGIYAVGEARAGASGTLADAAGDAARLASRLAVAA